MQTVDEVEAKLASVYKPVKATRLTGLWLYVQKFGTAKAKATLGDRPYYRAKADLKKAGVSLVEPPSNVIHVDRDFFQNFRFEVPSRFVTNRVDNFRNSENLLNLTKSDRTGN
jgi:hypothetical protein